MIKEAISVMSIKELYSKIRRYLYIQQLNRNGNFISGKGYVDKTSIFEGHNKVIGNTQLSECLFGKGSYIGTGCMLKKTKVGRFCSLGSNIWVSDGNHPTSEYVSTYPAFFRKGEFCGYNFGANDIFEEHSYTCKDHKWLCEIGNDVWIGDSVLILNGVKIGDGAIIAAGSVVTKDVSSYSIVGGVPAKILRYRFEKDQIKWLEEIKWWDKNDEWIKKNISLFEDIDKMIPLYMENEQ